MASTTSINPPLMTKATALTAMRHILDDKPFVFFGTGMSCALDIRFGMQALTSNLILNVKPNPQESQQVCQWKLVIESLENGDGLETALDKVTDAELLQKIIVATGRVISCIDREFALQIASHNVTWPATAFFKRQVEKLPEGDPVLHVLTPNYDTLFEHACDSVEIPYTSGFIGGLERQVNWRAAKYALLQGQRVRQGRRPKLTYKHRKHIRIYKVHGSLNLFYHRNKVVENNAWMWNAPNFTKRIMITPGLSKHEMLQKYRQELLAPADEAIDRANRFLFLGYGFNDTHLETYITRKLITQACQGLILTKESNPRIESLLGQARNLWLVCRTQQDGVDGTRISNKKYANCLFLPAKKYWDIETFTEEILGV